MNGIGQDLSTFRLPANFRGRGAAYVQLWWIVQALVFRPLPQIAFPLRRGLLRLFGAKIGRGVRIRPGVTVTFPWKLEIGDNSWIGDDVTLYCLGEITIGSNSVVSQETYVCAADHDMRSPSFAIRQRPVRIGDGVWIAARCFVSPGVTVADGAMVAACSVVTKNVPPHSVSMGSPSRVVRMRTYDPAGGN